jgi:ADP-heptose:LPS heptosyltransferase
MKNVFATWPPKSILALDASPFASSLALLPAIKALRAVYPKTLLVVAASTGICELLNASGVVDDTIDLKLIKSPDTSYVDTLGRLARLIRNSRPYSFDLILDFSPRLDTRIAARLFLRTRTITPSRPAPVIETLIGWAGGPKSVRQSGSSNYVNVLDQAGVELRETSVRFELPEEEHTRFEQRLVKAGSSGGELLVLLHSSNSNDSWPVASFAEVARRLANTFDARVIAIDQPSDSAFTDALNLLLPLGAIRLAEPSSFEFFAAIARASLAITDQTMVANIASELGTPALEIAGSTASKIDLSDNHKVLEGSSRKRIKTDEVYEAACEMIHKSRSAALFHRR